jgi:hypothetical protein
MDTHGRENGNRTAVLCRAACADGLDPFADGAVPVAPELMSRIRYGLGSPACRDLCLDLIADGADEIRADRFDCIVLD